MAYKGRQSYLEKKNRRNWVLRAAVFLAVMFVLYNAITFLFFSVWAVESSSMSPGFNPGDRLLFSSFALSAGAGDAALERGNIVLVNSGASEQGLPLVVLDSIVRFFTLQRASVFEGQQHYMKRVIGLPGDEISMENHIIRIRPQGSLFSLTEFEMIDATYLLVLPQIPALWDEALPFSNSMEPIILGAHEFFVVSDDRGNTNDSRTWGPVSFDDIVARAVFRLWPVTRDPRL
ncbi:MAG: signal peptidase I [Spirochaetes bacterium]|nr:signal peptidase I [Spirochaetota bacterium]